MNAVLTFLQKNRQRFELERFGVPLELSCIIATPRFQASRHVIFLLFRQESLDPVLVAKIPRLSENRAGVECEARALKAIQESRPSGFDSVPRLVAFEEHNGWPILLETALVGDPMNPRAIRHDRTGCCDDVTNWLCGLQVPGLVGGPPEANWYEKSVEEPIHILTKRLPLTARERRLLESSREILAPLSEENLCRVFEHGDLSHPNLFRMPDGQVGVIDWELADLQGLPTGDLFFFLSYASFASQKSRSIERQMQTFNDAFFGSRSWTTPYIKKYADELQISRRNLTPLFLLTWIRYLANLVLRLDWCERSDQHVRRHLVNRIRENRYFSLWRHTVEHQKNLLWSR